MRITIELPDEVASQLGVPGQDLERATLEAVVLDAYRTERLSESQIGQLLGFETRMELHAFLKEHGVYLNYSVKDLERDRETARRLRATRSRELQQDPPAPGQRLG